MQLFYLIHAIVFGTSVRKNDKKYVKGRTSSSLPGKIHLLHLWVPYESAKPLARRMSSMFLGEPKSIKIDKYTKTIKKQSIRIKSKEYRNIIYTKLQDQNL